MPQDILMLPISGPRGASSRYRMFQFLPALNMAGITYRLHYPPTDIGRGLARAIASWRERRLIRALASDAHISFVQKRLLTEGLTTTLAMSGRLVFDFDDAIFTSPTGDHSSHARRRVLRRLHATLNAADVVLVGNRYLADYATQFSRSVVILPTVIDTNRYPARQHCANAKPVIGWIGHSVNHPYLIAMQPMLARLAVTQSFRLLIVSDKDLVLPGIKVENRRWSEDTEVADILDMDVGIMPMPDDRWSRGKCGLKALQYMAAGVPVVCSAVGANMDIVRDGIDGFTVTTPEQWHQSLTELCANTECRVNLGLAARTRVRDSFSLASATPVLLNTFNSLICPHNHGNIHTL